MYHFFLTNILFKLHFSLTLYMTGIIWLVQVIHYPLFLLVGSINFPKYHRAHLEKTTSVIAIPMILEFLSGIYILYSNEYIKYNPLFIFSIFLLVFIWIITFLISVPKHNILSNGFDEHTIKLLIRTNWLRTFAWTARAVIIFYLLN